MNERINELRLDAGISRLHDEPYLVAVNKSGEIEDPMIGLEKFAELIVQECMNQVREQYLPVLEDELMMKDTHWNGYVQCGVDSYVAIREHFDLAKTAREMRSIGDSFSAETEMSR